MVSPELVEGSLSKGHRERTTLVTLNMEKTLPLVEGWVGLTWRIGGLYHADAEDKPAIPTKDSSERSV